ncbi:RnfH family protein [Neptuniibacter marinus]|uniref:RnfH family protein n=1 Tax=Neptuniibacter marinus TaxID=1806670 RepID=UPI0008312CE9|nr:RnfH family protein [Neptuniibacter marinus]
MIVEVAFALPTEQKIISLNVPDECTAYEAVIKSGIVEIFPEIDPETAPMGIFSKAIKNPKETVLREGQRVEIYRPLIADPKEVRAKRAAKMKAKKEAEAAAR